MILLVRIFQLQHNPFKNKLLRLRKRFYPGADILKALERFFLPLGKCISQSLLSKTGKEI